LVEVLVARRRIVNAEAEACGIDARQHDVIDDLRASQDRQVGHLEALSDRLPFQHPRVRRRRLRERKPHCRRQAWAVRPDRKPVRAAMAQQHAKSVRLGIGQQRCRPDEQSRASDDCQPQRFSHAQLPTP
jgi:hypothetical protein